MKSYKNPIASFQLAGLVCPPKNLFSKLLPIANASNLHVLFKKDLFSFSKGPCLLSPNLSVLTLQMSLTKAEKLYFKRLKESCMCLVVMEYFYKYLSHFHIT